MREYAPFGFPERGLEPPMDVVVAYCGECGFEIYDGEAVHQSHGTGRDYCEDCWQQRVEEGLEC